MSKPRVLVTLSPSPEMRDAFDDTLSGDAAITYLTEVDDDERAEALSSAEALLALFIRSELRGPDEAALLKSARLIQLLSAGVDQVPFELIPPGVEVACNAGSYADPMAEHVLAMALALAKRLVPNDEALRRGEWDQQTPSRAIRGATVGVLGFGGIGQASAKLFSALGARIHAVNRSGHTDQPVGWIGTLNDLDALLAAVDVLVISLPLTRATSGLIAERELSLMKPDAILVNVARAAILDEDALYEHLRRNPTFCAGLDVWWQEPHRTGSFGTSRPFLELPNVLGSPHNSAITNGSLTEPARLAAANVARLLRGEPVRHLIDRSDYMG